MEELKEGLRIIIEEANGRFITLETIILILVWNLSIIFIVLLSQKLQENLIK